MASMSALLECPICMEAFKDPRMLTSCLHSLCHKCLGDHITHAGRDGQFECPVCRQSLPVPDDGADAFPKNFFMNSCIDAVFNKGLGARSKTGQGSAAEGGRHGTRENQCSNTDDDLQCTQPEQFCLDCNEYYCRNCSKVHQKSKATRSHIQVAIDDLTDDLLRDAMAKSETPRCLKHKDETLKLYCSTCQSAVCSVCCHISHQSHTFREIEDIDKDLKSELNRAMESLKGLIDGGKQQTNQIQLSQQRAEKTTTTARETTKNVFQKIKQMSDQKAREIDQHICKIRQDSEAKTNVQTKNLTLHTELLDSLHTFTDDLLKRGTVYNRLASLPDVRNRIKEFQGSPLSSADGATVTEMPNSADLVAKHLDGLVMTQEVKLGGPGSAAGSILEIKTTCSSKQLLLLQTAELDKTKDALNKAKSTVKDMGVQSAILEQERDALRKEVRDHNTVIQKLKKEAQEGHNLHDQATKQLVASKKDTDSLREKTTEMTNRITQLEDERNLLTAKLSRATTPGKVPKTVGATALLSKKSSVVLATAPLLEKPKLSVVVYNWPGSGWSRLVVAAVQSLNTRLTCDVSDTDTIQLQPEVTDRPQVDVIDCQFDDINSVVDRYKITETTVGQRHLVLVHASPGGNLTKTQRALGHHVRELFKSVIWYGLDDASEKAAIASLADYFLQVAT